MSFGKVSVIVGGGSMAKKLAHAGICGNSDSGNHPPDTVTLAKSVEVLTNPILTKSTNEGGREGKSTPTITGYLEVEVDGKLVHSKKRGDGYVDSLHSVVKGIEYSRVETDVWSSSSDQYEVTLHEFEVAETNEAIRLKLLCHS
ncbi:hypothetical protein ACROYT_G040216 [Oculina patagonica]